MSNNIETLRKSGLTEEAAKMFAKKIEYMKLKNSMNDRAKYREVTAEQQEKIDDTRKIFSILYNFIEEYCKNSRETSLAITKLEEAQFWAIKGITREE